MSSKLWGGRFNKNTDSLVEEFHSSIGFDKRLYYFDIKGSKAHAKMLAKIGVLTTDEMLLINTSLDEILKDIEDGKVEFNSYFEDIHMNIEHLLTKKIGNVGKKLHTGRSRNDQIALDMRMYLLSEISNIKLLIVDFLKTLHFISKEHTSTVMPGYTHLQRAQPITFSHHLMAYFEMFKRDLERLEDCKKRTNSMPLGCGALAGSSFELDREFTAKELNFENICQNSLDGVSDRDFIIEFQAFCSIAMMHLSRLCEEIVLWSSQEFNFVELDDAYSTGSSIMPQKKNPDVAELIRGKTGRVYGNLLSILTVMKSLPLAYNKDMQEDKESLFDSIDTIKKCLLFISPMLKTMKLKKDNMRAATKQGFTNATDLADYLVRKGLAFRDAHEVVGKLVAHCIAEATSLEDLDLNVLKSFSDFIAEDVYENIAIDKCVEVRNTIGAPSKSQMENALKNAELFLTKLSEENNSI